MKQRDHSMDVLRGNSYILRDIWSYNTYLRHPYLYLGIPHAFILLVVWVFFLYG